MHQLGDMWSQMGSPNAALFVTTNGALRRDGGLVMGRGIAAETLAHVAKGVGEHAANAYQQWCGRRVVAASLNTIEVRGQACYEYGICPPRMDLAEKSRYYRIGLFQVKHHWSQSASLALISWSAVKLAEWCKENSEVQVHLNFPGIGNGRLRPAQVEPYLKPLEGLVTIWRKEA